MRAVLVTVMAAVAAVNVFAGAGEGRGKFIETEGKKFAGCRVVGPEAVDEANDFFRSKKDSKWYFVLPFDSDERVRFLEAEMKGGKLRSGVMHAYGMKDEKITPKQFEKIREVCPLIGFRKGGLRSEKIGGETLAPAVVLYPMSTRPAVKKGPFDHYGLSLDPASMALDRLRHGAGLMKLDLSHLKYEVTLEGKDGTKVVMGIGTAASAIRQEQALGKIRAALEARYPERTGAVSDRDAVDFYQSSKRIIRAVK